jgi:hypothetical protein
MWSSDPKRVEREFRISKNSYDHGDDEIVPNKQAYWRISLFFKRKEGVSAEYFARHWHHVHGDLITAAKSYCDNNILRYNQFHQTPEGRKKVEELGYGPVLDFDAVTEFWVKDVAQFKAFTESEEFASAGSEFIARIYLHLQT